jgi:hypothetical protein
VMPNAAEPVPERADFLPYFGCRHTEFAHL